MADTKNSCYLMVVSAHCFPVSEHVFAAEGAFSEHLKRLFAMMSDRFDEILVAAPVVDEKVFNATRGSWKLIDAQEDHIRLVPMHRAHSGRREYWFRHLVPNVIRLNMAVREASVVHAGPSHIYRPFDVVAILLAIFRKKPSVFVVDIDQRRTPWMNLMTGVWSRRSYLAAKYLHVPAMSLQIRMAAKCCSLVLLKGRKFAADFGKGRSNVKDFIDSAYDGDHVIPALELERKIETLADSARPLKLVFFGRLVPYKGIDRSLEAVAAVIREYGPIVRFTIIGVGPEEYRLRELSSSLRIADYVDFLPPISFGNELFACLRQQDLLLGTPMSEDTPRSALDALASGVPVLAFDTYYYRDLQRSGAVEVVPWPSVDALAARIGTIARDKTTLSAAIRNAAEFASSNTQEEWLRRRYQWTLEAIEKSPRNP